jgi:hypothetical protein
MKTDYPVFRFVLLLFVCASVAAAQTSFGTITGAVTDSSGAAIPNATITIVNQDTGARRVATAGALGVYTAPSLVAGTYTVTAEAPGFKRQVRPLIRLRVNETSQVDFQMQVGEVQESVEVVDEAPLLNTTSSTQGGVVTNEKIVNMPLNGRQFTQLILLMPGVSGRQPAASGLDNNLSGVSPSVNGARPQNNNFTLDGVENNESFFNSFAISPSVDAIQEFKVQSHISSAEFGKAAGANINVQFRSGTNQIHGVAYNYLRNAKLDARNPFVPTRGQFQQNQFGGTIGGPVYLPKIYDGRNRTFFFYAAEAFRQVRGLTPPTAFVPTPQELAGDLSGGRAIFNPFTTRAGPTGGLVRDAFPGNRIPASLINRASSIIAQQFYPAPNLTGVPGRNVINPKNQVQDDDQWNIKFDHRFSDSNNMFFRYSANDRHRITPTSLPVIDTTLFNRNTNAVLSDTHVLNPTTIIDLKVALNRTYLGNANTPQDPAVLFQQTGIQGYVVQSQEFPMFPIISVAGYAGIAQDATVFGPFNNFQYLGTVTKIRGRHTMKAGYDIRRQQLFTGSYRAGNIGFDAIPSADPQNRSNTGQPLASFLLGLPSTASRAVGDTNVRMRGSNFHFFLQDDIRVHSRLTLNFGLRYEYNQLPYDKDGRVSAFDLRNGNILFAARNPITGEPANVRRSLTDPDWNNFAPRVGLAWTLNSKTTVRMGYGWFYNSNFMQEQQGGRGQWPFALNQNETNLNIDFPTNPLQNIFQRDPASTIAFGSTRAIAGRTAYSQQWNLSVQRQVGGNLVVEGSYVGGKGTKLYTNWRGNAAPPGPGAVNPRRPFPQFGTITESNPRGASTYHAMQWRVERRFVNGFSLLTSYAWGKSIDDSSTLITLSQHNPFDLRQEKGRSEYDLRHNLTVTYVYELPFGPGKPMLSGLSGFGKALLAGWQVNGITSYRTGLPIRIVIPTDTANTGVSGGQRPNLVGNAILPASDRTTERWFNTAAFAVPAAFTFGNLGRHPISGPGVANWDFGAYKNFPIRERMLIQFRAEIFNIFNHTNLALPGGTVTTAQFGRIAGTSTDARDVQLALRFQF